MAVLAIAPAGCGAHRAKVPDVARPQLSTGSRLVFFPAAGLRFAAPMNWQSIAGAAPLVATITSGEAVIAVWRYPRAEPLPRGRAALRQARKRLIAAARARDATLKLMQARTLRLSGAPAVAIFADEQISGQARRVVSTHVFAHGAEIVFDAYAPVADFALANSTAFLPLLRSVHVARPRGS